MAIQFKKDEGAGKTIYEWWQGLDKHREDRATLRRAATVTDVAMLPAYQRLLSRVDGSRDWSYYRRDCFAAAVALLAHLKVESGQSLPESMSEKPSDSDRNPVSDLRFRRLLESPDIDALFTGLRRVLPLIDHKTDPLQLVIDVFHWGDNVKKRWAYAYRWTPSKN
ncbi:type I-E CRISPR-associated protein Cse2/CasB [Azohydromonas lata]|uniref:type I-E CRISPR-associated protein Cse2/CasB n=1 Tax=Azohydromonas lata TaxID=45677 RepID=UPI00082F0FC1|nr:type I-E CRISPR-associated protein Cse2/CasB [Azohydromonas lata]